jgi:hypothetical protein
MPQFVLWFETLERTPYQLNQIFALDLRNLMSRGAEPGFGFLHLQQY